MCNLYVLMRTLIKEKKTLPFSSETIRNQDSTLTLEARVFQKHANQQNNFLESKILQKQTERTEVNYPCLNTMQYNRRGWIQQLPSTTWSAFRLPEQDFSYQKAPHLMGESSWTPCNTRIPWSSSFHYEVKTPSFKACVLPDPLSGCIYMQWQMIFFPSLLPGNHFSIPSKQQCKHKSNVIPFIRTKQDFFFHCHVAANLWCPHWVFKG